MIEEVGKKTPLFKMFNGFVYDDLIKDSMFDYTSYLGEILDQNIYVLIYAGEFDG